MSREARKQQKKYLISERVFFHSGFCFIFLIISLSKTTAQWREIYLGPSVGYSYIYVFPSNKKIILAGEYQSQNLRVWKSVDQGKSWKVVLSISDLATKTISSFTFKDSLTGWLTIQTGARKDGGCYKTTDAGESWFFLPSTLGNANFLCYNSYNNTLFMTTGSTNLLTKDGGANWLPFGDINMENSTGIVFIDNLRGLLAQPSNEHDHYPFYITNDGGIRWDSISFIDTLTNHPTAIKDKIFFTESWPYLGISPTTTYILYPWGTLPQKVGQIDVPTTTSMRTDSINLYIQVSKNAATLNTPYHGILKSSDEGKSWKSICGPNNGFLTDFYVDSTGEIWAGGISEINGYYTALYHNSTGRSNSPRIQFEINNLSRQIQLYTGDIATVSFYYPAEKYFEPVDSISFIVNYSKSINYLRDSIAEGWVIIRREFSDTSVRFIVKRIDPLIPSSETPILKVFYQSYISDATSATIALDEIAFNQDVPQRPCMLDELKSTDSLYISFIDKCGDSLIRTLAEGKLSASISSIYPNPANDHVTVSIESAVLQEAEIECINALGQISFSQKIVLKQGSSTLPVLVKDLFSGLYVLRIRTANGAVSQSFLKE
jgi:hypothetical protein